MREELAARLVEVFILGNGGQVEHLMSSHGLMKFSVPSDPDKFPQAQFLDFLPVADECIRQMEWARRDLAVALDRDMAIVGPSLVEIPLTAAPEEWQVPK